MKKNIFDMIIRPVYTQKSELLYERHKQRSFYVLPCANKSNLKKVVQEVFSVEVAAINIVNVKPKKKTFKGIRGVRNGMKKAIISFVSDVDLESVFGE